MKFVLAATALMMTAGMAQAKPRIAIEGILGFNGEGEHDGIDTDQGQAVGDGDEDVESNFGVQATLDFPVGPVRIGGRAAFITSEGDDTDGKYNTITGGGFVRFPFVNSPLQVYAAGSLGVSYMTIDDWNVGIAEVEASGIALHFLLGVGIDYPVSPGLSLSGGLYYDRHSGELEGEEQGIDFEVKDGLLSRFLLTAGVAF